jgi:metal-responsive CopG/Arc/MetJ family transcriptional regulator
MSTMDATSIETFSDLNVQQLDKNIIGNMIIVIPNDYLIQKKLNKIETRYKDQIISKNQHFHGENIIIFLMVEANVDDLQNIVVEINGIEELKNFRYLIVN